MNRNEAKILAPLIKAFGEGIYIQDGRHYGWHAFLECFTYIDGTPCGTKY